MIREASIWIIRLTLFGVGVGAACLEKQDMANTFGIALVLSFVLLDADKEK